MKYLLSLLLFFGLNEALGQSVFDPVIVKLSGTLPKAYFDYKVSLNDGIGHRVRVEGSNLKYSSFSGLIWSKEEVVVDQNGQAIQFITNNIKFLAPHMAVGKDKVYIAWGNGTLKNNGLKLILKSLNDKKWQGPIDIFSGRWFETFNMTTENDELHMMLNELRKLPGVAIEKPFINFYKFEGLNPKLIQEIQAPAKEPMISQMNGAGLWYLSWFYDGLFFNPLNPALLIEKIKSASWLSGVVLPMKDYQVAYFMTGKKKVGSKLYYYPKSINFKNPVKSLVLYTFPIPSDEILKKNKQWTTSQHIFLTTLGGKVRVFFDNKKDLKMALINQNKVELKEGLGACDEVNGATFEGVRSDVLCRNGVQYILRK